MASKITVEQIKQINDLYLKYKTYAAVAREIGVSASTVKKYVDPNYSPVNELAIKRFNIDEDYKPCQSYLFDEEITTNKDELYNLIQNGEKDEIAEMKELWEEIDV